LGDHLDAAPHSGVARPDVNCHAGFNSTRRRSTKCHPQITASAVASEFAFAVARDPPAMGPMTPGLGGNPPLGPVA
jgi:hypothetical protein